MANRQGLMKRLLMILAAAGMAYTSAHSGIGDWKNYTAMNSLMGVASSHDSVWAATSGGAFLYILHDSAFVRFTNSEGLTTNALTAIAIDRAGSIWFGQSDGSIDVFTPAAGRWRYIRDIAVSDKSQKSITSFFLAGDSMYIATSFGVSLFSISRFEFIDTYGNFGTSMPPPVLSVVRFKDRVYAATANGIAVSKASAVNLAAPDSWYTYQLPGVISTLTIFNGQVLGGGDGGLFTFDGASWLPIAAVSQPVALRGQSDALLYFTRYHYLYSYALSGAVQQIGSLVPSSVTSGTVAAGIPVFGTDSLGLAQWKAAAGAWVTSAPNGPASNSFASIAVGSDGAIWAASGGLGGGNGSGFYSFNGSSWSNYSTSTLPGLRNNDCYAIAMGPNNSKWVSTWGGGLVLLNEANRLVRIFDDVSPGLVGVNDNVHFVVPSVVAVARDGNIWVSIFRSANLSKVVWKMNPDSTWVAFPAAQGDYNRMLGLTIDRNDTKWFINQLSGFQPDGRRIVYLNEKLAVAGTSDGWGSLTVADGVTSTGVSCVVEDREGQLWLGTSVGITVISDPLRPLAQNSISKIFLGAVRDQTINCIAVDALNNKWIGTSRGVFLLSPDGTSLLDQYTVANSNGKLVDDNIISIAFDTKKGVAYFGTSKGLSSVGITTIAPAPDYSGMSAAPNPFHPAEQPYVMLQGLADGTTIKIITISGKLVKQFAAQGGGRAFWDGKTEMGEPVASGIYIAVAYSDNGSKIGTTKVAVIRR